jgi:hypothetical protein
MSNHLAAATVTATLSNTLQAALDAAAPGVANAKVTTLRPNTQASQVPTGINIFLYQTLPNFSLRNEDLPTRRGSGSVAQLPQAALDLHYLLSFNGDDTKLEPQILLGIATRALHTQPVLTRQMIKDTLATQMFKSLEQSDLADAPELVRFTPIALSLEELSKIWSVVFQTPYVLSAVYRASVVMIEGLVTPQPALPVRSRVISVDASLGPVIEQVTSLSPSGAPTPPGTPIVAGDTLAIIGRDLKGAKAVTRVRIGDAIVVPDTSAIDDTVIRVPLPATLSAGAQTVQVVRGPVAEPSPLDRTSNTAAFALQPQITAQVVGTAARIGFTPPVGPQQRVVLLLNELTSSPTATPRAYRFDVPARTATAPATSLDIDIRSVGSGVYLARVQVDGAESSVVYDATAGRYAAPQVTVP